MLDERKLRILRAIIDDYIDSAEPIGSRHLARKHDMGISSATIRNEMSDLEEMGFLEQPYTSAGRIPSDKGYRLYVDQLMNVQELSLQDLHQISKGLEQKIGELSELIQQASSIVSKITNYTSVAVSPRMSSSIVKAVQIVPVELGRALVIVVTNAGIIRNTLVNIPFDVLPDYLIIFSIYINNKLKGLTLSKITPKLLKEIEIELNTDPRLIAPVLDGVIECIAQIDKPEYYLDGSVNIFNYPEFQDIQKAQKFLHTIEKKETLNEIVNSMYSDSGLIIKIGSENHIEGMEDCSLLMTTYSVGDEVIGTIGVIGPTRMNYSKVVTSLNYICKKINYELNNLLGKNNNKERK